MQQPYSFALAVLVCAVPTAVSAQPVTTVYFAAAGPQLEPSEGAPTAPSEGVTSPQSVDPAPEPSSGERANPTQRCHGAVTLLRRIGGARERITMPLLDCEGRVHPGALRAVSILARPRQTIAIPDDDDDVHLLEPELIERIQRIAEAFEGHEIEILSGYRPDSEHTSRHHDGAALDIDVLGVERERLRDLVVDFESTGVGFYPNSIFVHVDVREEPTYWVDLSGPGEAPRYVPDAQPPAPDTSPASDAEIATVRREMDRLLELIE